MTGAACITGVGVLQAAAGSRCVDDAALEGALDGLQQRRLRRADRAGCLAVAAARRALADANCEPGPDLAVVMGLDYATYPANFAHQRRVATEGARFASPAEFTLTLPNITTAFVAIAFGLRGPTTTLADGGVAGGTALGVALDWIRTGTATRVLAGVAEPAAPGEPDWWPAPLGRTPARAENAACWLLEAPDAAAARGARVRARLRGYGGTTGEGCVGTALQDAGLAGTPPVWSPVHLAGLSARLETLAGPAVAEWVGLPPQRRAVVLEPAP